MSIVNGDRHNSQPFIYEQAETLSLHFGDELSVQSTMRIDAPDTLQLEYTRTMMGFLLFVEWPRHIGMIGLGGGSLQKHCYRCLPDTQISVAEISPEVIALRERFCIPEDDHRFQIFREDGAEFVRRCRGQFDALVVDGFDGQGLPSQLCSRDFYDDCYSALARHGVMVVNLCDTSLSTSLWRLQQSFGKGLFAVEVEDSANTVVFAGKGHVWSKTEEELQRSQANVERFHSINLRQTVQDFLVERKARCSFQSSRHSRRFYDQNGAAGKPLLQGAT
jgi:spermidine synthase